MHGCSFILYIHSYICVVSPKENVCSYAVATILDMNQNFAAVLKMLPQNSSPSGENIFSFSARVIKWT